MKPDDPEECPMSDQSTVPHGRAQAAFHPAVGVHDPVRLDRVDGARDLGHPGRRVPARRRRRTDPRHVPGGGREAGADPGGLPDRADQRSLRHRERRRQHQLLQRGRPVRGHRRRPVHHRDRRVPGSHHADRRDPGRHRTARRGAAGPRTVDDPDPDVRLRTRRVDLRHGGGEPGLLRPGDLGDDRRGLRLVDGRGGGPARVRYRDPGFDDQPVRHRHRLRLRRGLDQRRVPVPADHPRGRAGDRDLLRDAVRRPGQARPHAVGRARDEGVQRGAFQRQQE